MRGVRRVVGRDAVDGAVEQARRRAPRGPRRSAAAGSSSGSCRSRRERVLVEEQVVRRDLARSPRRRAPSPRARARREPAVERCARCSRQPVSSASAMSRATMTSSAAAGQPGSPSRVETTPSLTTPLPDERLVLAVRDDGGVERAWRSPSRSRIMPASCTPLPSSENATAPSASMSPISASASPFWPDGERADRVHAHAPALGGALDEEAHRGALVADRLGVRHRADRREAAVRRRARAALRRLPCTRSPARAGACARRRGPGTTIFSAHSTVVALRRSRGPCPTSTITPSRDDDVADLVEPDRRVDDAAALKQQRHSRHLPAAGTSRPCARRHRR